jgi:putative endonuclease
MQPSYVYILTNKRNGTLYIGVTSNLIQRIWQHKNNVIKGFSSKYKLHMLIHYEEHPNIIEAIKREKCLKRWKRLWKLKLIEECNSEWRDLYDEII